MARNPFSDEGLKWQWNHFASEYNFDLSLLEFSENGRKLYGLVKSFEFEPDFGDLVFSFHWIACQKPNGEYWLYEAGSPIRCLNYALFLPLQVKNLDGRTVNECQVVMAHMNPELQRPYKGYKGFTLYLQSHPGEWPMSDKDVLDLNEALRPESKTRVRPRLELTTDEWVKLCGDVVLDVSKDQSSGAYSALIVCDVATSDVRSELQAIRDNPNQSLYPGNLDRLVDSLCYLFQTHQPDEWDWSVLNKVRRQVEAILGYDLVIASDYMHQVNELVKGAGISRTDIEKIQLGIRDSAGAFARSLASGFPTLPS